MPSLGDLWKLGRTVDDLLSMERRNGAGFDEIGRRLDLIEGRLTVIEADRERMVTEARAAAATAASVAASAHLTAMALAIGALEERVRHMDTRAPLPPSAAKRKRLKTSSG